MSSNPSPTGLSRRTFLGKSTLLSLTTLLSGRSLAATLDGKGRIALVVAPDDAFASSDPSVWARGELTKALEAHGSRVRVLAKVHEAAADEFCVLIAGASSPVVASVLRSQVAKLPVEAESLCLVQGELEGRPVLLAAGGDPRGLVYALTELADRVSCLATGRAALEFKDPVFERPASRIRSIMRGFNSEVEDKTWFYDRDYWCAYLTMLVSSRINRLNFTTGMGYNSARGISDGYLIFPYPFFVKPPGHKVRARGLSDDERARNLATLKFIGEECVRRGLQFQFGIWTLAHDWQKSPEASYRTEGLTDAAHPSYCRDALAELLKEVPTISGVTFRVHSESGIPKGRENFWETQFKAVADCGRRVEIDLHAKNMTPETLGFALATGQPVVVSPKYCGEHISLPYHQASIRTSEMGGVETLEDTGEGLLLGNRRFTRNGYADMLAENRTWDVVFRIWPGTQRFLLNGDPATFAGYARSASFCGAAGIELSEPLHFKGRQGSGHEGGRCAYADASLNPRRDFEKYLITYRLWGRLGYNPDTDPEVWRRALRRDFGPAAPSIEAALAAASRVLPLFTLAHGQSADCQRFWPEIYRDMMIADEKANESHRDTRPPRLFGNVCPFDPQLFQSPDECADALLAGETTGKYSPLEVAQWLDDLATASLRISEARTALGPAASAPAFRRLEEDILIQRGLALLFAAKLRSAVLWRIHARAGNRDAGAAAIAVYQKGRDAWAAMAERARHVYQTDISYGRNSVRGHWIDRIPAFDADLADLRRRLKTAPEPADKFDPAAVARALKVATSKPRRKTVAAEHEPAPRCKAGQPLPVVLRCEGTAPHRVLLHYRHVNQSERWQATELKRDGQTFSGDIPAAFTAGRYPVQYYFEIETGPSEATLFPPLAKDLANVPYYVVRTKDAKAIR